MNVVSLLFCSLGFVGSDPAPTETRADAAALSTGLTTFASDLLRVCDDEEGNVDVAPISIARALAMARLGAAGNTAAQIDRALHVDGVDLARRFRALGVALDPSEVERRDGTKVRPFQLELSSALFVQQGFDVMPAFDDVLRDTFRSQGVRLDFRNAEKAAGVINEWIATSTQGRVPSLVEPSDLSSDTRIVLADAVFFRAAWKDPFRATSTRDGTFTAADGRAVTVPMMRKVERFGFGETERATVLEIEHEKGLTSMVFVLPKPGVSTRDLADHEDFAQWFACLKTQGMIDAHVPRFVCEKKTALRDEIRKLGVVDLFDVKACDLSGITTKEPLYVSDVLHRARLAIDEQGTEAAAATAAVFKAGSARPQDPTPFVLDRPFLFALRHREAGVVLFCGRVDDPTAK